jgi:hypothetical protein
MMYTSASLQRKGAGSVASGAQGPWYENGQLLMLLAAQSMAVGTLMVPWVTRFVDPVMATGWHMILGGLPLVGLSLATEQAELGRLSLIDSGTKIYLLQFLLNYFVMAAAATVSSIRLKNSFVHGQLLPFASAKLLR